MTEQLFTADAIEAIRLGGPPMPPCDAWIVIAYYDGCVGQFWAVGSALLSRAEAEVFAKKNAGDVWKYVHIVHIVLGEKKP